MTFEIKNEGERPSPVCNVRFLEVPEGPPANFFSHTLQRFGSYLFTMNYFCPLTRSPRHYHLMFRLWLMISILYAPTSHDSCNVPHTKVCQKPHFAHMTLVSSRLMKLPGKDFNSSQSCFRDSTFTPQDSSSRI